MIKEIFVARPGRDCDYIFIVYDENEKYYITSHGKLLKSIVDTNKSWHNNYYFSSKEKQTDWYKRFNLSLLAMTGMF